MTYRTGMALVQVAICFTISCGPARAAEPPFFVKPWSQFCSSTAPLIHAIPKSAIGNSCHSSLSKPVGVVVLDVVPAAGTFVWVCKMEDSYEKVTTLPSLFSCGYAKSADIINRNGEAPSLQALKSAASSARMEDVSRMGVAAFGCEVRDSEKWC